MSGPTGFDLRTTTVTIRTRTWTGGEDGAEVGVGSCTDSDVTLTPRPKVKELGDTEVEIGPITPSHSSGGYTVAQLNPDLSALPGTEVLWVLVGANGTRYYQLTDIITTKSFRYMCRLKAINDSGRLVPL